jgi:hypothetical protein
VDLLDLRPRGGGGARLGLDARGLVGDGAYLVLAILADLVAIERDREDATRAT